MRDRNTGRQHVGIGVKDIEAGRAFYRDVLQYRKQYADFGRVWNVMPHFFRTAPHVLAGWTYHQDFGGIIVECVQRHDPSLRRIHTQTRFGDIDINKQTIEVTNVHRFVREYEDKRKFLSEPRTTTIPGWTDYGYLEACHLSDDILGPAKYLSDEGVEFECSPSPIDADEQNFQGTMWFVYIRDPDGIPIEVLVQ